MPGYISSLVSAYGATAPPVSPTSLVTVTHSHSPPTTVRANDVNVDDVVDTSKIAVPSPKACKFSIKDFLAKLKSKIIGQDQALESLAKIIGAHVRKRKAVRPISLLLAGPTGVGKTKTAELTAEALSEITGKDWGYIRVDMNQLKEAHHTSKLVGTTAGYVGYGDLPVFAPLLDNPRHLVLFDEAEKANPAILEFLMNAMSDGRLELSKPIDGVRCVDFTQSVFLFTSNIPLSVENPEKMSQAEITAACKEQLRNPKGKDAVAMPAEVVARFTEVLLFRQLSPEDRVRILTLSVIRLGESYDLCVQKISEELLQDAVNKLSVEKGVRDAEYELDGILGTPMADFADEHDAKDVKLSGTMDNIIVEPFAQLP